MKCLYSGVIVGARVSNTKTCVRYVLMNYAHAALHRSVLARKRSVI